MKTYKFGKLVVERYRGGPIEVNNYIVYEEGASEVIIIDPGFESDEVVKRVELLKPSKITIYLTHGHGDHIGGIEFLRSHFTDAKVAISVGDAEMITNPEENLSIFIDKEITLKPAEILLKEGDTIKTGSHIGVITLLPGHTRGGSALIFDEVIFSGDSLFYESIGRTDFPGGDGRTLIHGLKDKILTLSDRPVFPGHGNETSVEHEKRNNMYLF